MACHIAKCDYCCLAVYEESPGEALEAIKTVVMQCGITEHPTCLLVTESSLGPGQVSYIVTPRFCECIFWVYTEDNSSLFN